jgi:hypothetical protein
MTDYHAAAARWNTIVLGSFVLPGKTKLYMPKCGRDVDQQKQKGSNKSYSEDSGKNLASGKIVGMLPSMNCQAYEEWLEVLEAIDPASPSASTGPLEIHHPATEQRGVDAIRITNISSPPPTAKDGYVYEIQWIEYAEKPKTVKKAKKKKATGARAPGDQQPLIQPFEPGTSQYSGLEGFDDTMSQYGYEPDNSQRRFTGLP